MLVNCVIYNTGSSQRFLTFNACATHSAMVFATFITAPCLTVVDAQRLSLHGNVSFRDIRIGGHHLDSRIGTFLCGQTHRFHERRATVRIDSMISTVVGHHHILQSVTLSKTGSYELQTLCQGYKVAYVIPPLPGVEDD